MADFNFTDKDFKTQVLENSGVVMVDFWAPWCGPCRAVSPVIDEVAEEYKGKIKVGKVNVDDNTEVPGQYGIMSLPSIVFFKDGKPVKTMVGVQGKENYKQEIESLLAS
jgi:thioredoxin 1